MPTVAIAVPELVREYLFPPDQWKRLADLATVLTITPGLDLREVSVLRSLTQADVLVTAWDGTAADPVLLAAAPRLRGIVRVGGPLAQLAGADGTDGVSGAARSPVGPAVAFTTEYAVCLVLLAAKQVPRSTRLYRRQRCAIDRESHFPGAGLNHRRVGVVGQSAVSRQIVAKLRLFDVDIYLHESERGSAPAAPGMTSVDLDTIFACCEVILLAPTRQSANQPSVTGERIRSIKNEATLIKLSGSMPVNLEILGGELATGRFEAILDAADPELAETASNLLDLPNVWLAPLLADTTARQLNHLGEAAVTKVLAILAGETTSSR